MFNDAQWLNGNLRKKNGQKRAMLSPKFWQSFGRGTTIKSWPRVPPDTAPDIARHCEMSKVEHPWDGLMSDMVANWSIFYFTIQWLGSKYVKICQNWEPKNLWMVTTCYHQNHQRTIILGHFVRQVKLGRVTDSWASCCWNRSQSTTFQGPNMVRNAAERTAPEALRHQPDFISG